MDDQQPSTAASRESIWNLWRGLLRVCVHYLETVPPEQQQAAMLGVIRAFLKDNGIAVDAGSVKDAIDSAKQLEDLKFPFPSN